MSADDPNQSLQKEALRFLDRYFRSVEQLEVLLFLKQRAGQAFTAEEISREFRSSPTSIGLRLGVLSKLRLLAVDEAGSAYVFQPASKGLHRIVDTLDRLYFAKRWSLIERIASRPHKAFLDFAEAFHLTENDDD